MTLLSSDGPSHHPCLPSDDDQVDTSGAIFSVDLLSEGAAEATWVPVANTPRLDNDCMPKDRMALLADPTNASLLYVAGNAQ